MKKLLQVNAQVRSALNYHWNWFLVWGIALMVLGAIAISTATITTLISVVVIGFLLFTSGAILLVDSLTTWWKKGGGFLFHFVMGILYILVGAMLVHNPLTGSISLTLLLGIFYCLLGAGRMIYAFSLRLMWWKWQLANGIISLILGILIIAEWPQSSLFVIGLFIGIDLLFCGWAYLMYALYGRITIEG